MAISPPLAPPLRLGVNIDHIATIRNARGGAHPDPARAVAIIAAAGGDGLTLHLREDRRHIREHDLIEITAHSPLPINLEMAATEEMLAIALRHKPHAVCIVPEGRQERTTEGGLDVVGQRAVLAPIVDKLAAAEIRVSLFVEPEKAQLAAALDLGAAVVELHTGRYAEIGNAETESATTPSELQRLIEAAAYAADIGLECHAGHGLTFANVAPIAAIPQLTELNIGHYLIGEAIYIGLEASIRSMREIIDQARRESLENTGHRGAAQ